TVRMIRSTWKAHVCVYLQRDDKGNYRIRAFDGLTSGQRVPEVIKADKGVVTQCQTTNETLESGAVPWEQELVPLFENGANPHGKKYVVVPVPGQSQVIGVMILGPFAKDKEFKSIDTELRSAGALCAVLSAYLRLYDWTQTFIPQMNHELRTPL